MNGKQQIEELAKVLCPSYTKKADCETCPTEWCYAYECATMAFCNNYRKIAEDSIVLTKKEYDELKGRAEEVFNEMTARMKAEVQIERKMGNRKVEQACKEKALEIYIWFKNIFMNNETFGRGVFGWTTDDLMVVLDVFAKQFNIEVENARI